MHIHIITRQSRPVKANSIVEILNTYLQLLGALGGTLGILAGFKGAGE